MRHFASSAASHRKYSDVGFLSSCMIDFFFLLLDRNASATGYVVMPVEKIELPPFVDSSHLLVPSGGLLQPGLHPTLILVLISRTILEVQECATTTYCGHRVIGAGASCCLRQASQVELSGVGASLNRMNLVACTSSILLSRAPLPRKDSYADSHSDPASVVKLKLTWRVTK